MEKQTPHCKLSVIKALIAAGKVRTTQAARAGANELGFDFSDVLAVVVALTPADFHKSMTTHADHTVWQDVYRPRTQAGDVYLKLTVIDDMLLPSLFQEENAVDFAGRNTSFLSMDTRLCVSTDLLIVSFKEL
ncbi:type II toxin-antitoxin system MqsR family toxin [Propionivibrio sp.]|uniref:type II toxin-antitoxin system MqsR family toxin n=1 Tax=Propionivibrio sp. TaxID=2212460 RepID=UPI003BF1A6D0